MPCPENTYHSRCSPQPDWEATHGCEFVFTVSLEVVSQSRPSKHRGGLLSILAEWHCERMSYEGQPLANNAFISKTNFYF